jgi:hypothetical protein
LLLDTLSYYETQSYYTLKGIIILSITPYGNAPAGEHPAIFTGAFEVPYPKGKRQLFGFAILNADRQTPHDGPDGGGLWAVAVCNPCVGKNPKSKPFLIRRAMLQPEEFQDLALSINPPPAEHFEPKPGNTPRVLDIRVVSKQEEGKRVSIVTHICRPRDGVWQLIEGVFEGLGRPAAPPDEQQEAPRAQHTAKEPTPEPTPEPVTEVLVRPRRQFRCLQVHHVPWRSGRVAGPQQAGFASHKQPRFSRRVPGQASCLLN